MNQTESVGQGGRMRDNIDNLRGDLGRLRDDVGGAARDLAGVARTGVQEAGRYASEAVEVVRERSGEAVESARETIRGNPLISVGVAFGAGVLISMLARRF